MAVLIPVKPGKEEYIPPPGGKAKWGWRDLQAVVGGTFELLFPSESYARAGAVTQVLVVHEEGKVLGLPVNKDATELWQTWGGRGKLRGPCLLVKSQEIE